MMMIMMLIMTETKMNCNEVESIDAGRNAEVPDVAEALVDDAG